MPKKQSLSEKAIEKAQEIAIGKAKDLLSAIGGEATEWVTEQVLGVLGLADEEKEDRTAEQIETLQLSVNSVLDKQEKLSKKIDSEFGKTRLALNVKYADAIGFIPVERIRYFFSRMQNVVGGNNTDDIEALQISILSDDDGVAFALFALNDVLMGNNSILPSSGDKENDLSALSIAMRSILKRHSVLSEQPDYSFKTLNVHAKEYLEDIINIQVMGLTLIINAERSKNHGEINLAVVNEHIEKMVQQKVFFQSLIPNWVMDKGVWQAEEGEWQAEEGNWLSGKYLRSKCKLQHNTHSTNKFGTVDTKICYHKKDGDPIMAGWCSQMPECEETWDVIPIDWYRDQNLLRTGFNGNPPIENWAKDIFSLAVVDKNTLNRRHLTIGQNGNLLLMDETAEGFLPRLAYFRFIFDEQSSKEILFWNDPLMDDNMTKVNDYLSDPNTFIHGNRFKHEQIRLKYTAAPVGYVICLNIDKEEVSDPSQKYVKIGEALGSGNSMRHVTLALKEYASQIQLGFPDTMSKHNYHSDTWMNDFRKMGIAKKDDVTNTLDEWTYSLVEYARAINCNNNKNGNGLLSYSREEYWKINRHHGLNSIKHTDIKSKNPLIAAKENLNAGGLINIPRWLEDRGYENSNKRPFIE
ncbi:MAG: hypothetical protein ACI936_003463 [Paraglaciecola sp.]|jgi:hypothetical protein